jgi:hypothetical protein
VDRIAEILDGRKIQVTYPAMNGMPSMPAKEFEVFKVKDVSVSPNLGRSVLFVDENHQNRAVGINFIAKVR